MAQGIILAEIAGFNVAAGWTLFWVLFFARLFLGAAVGLEELSLRFRQFPPGPKSSEGRSLYYGNVVVTALNVTLLLMFATLTRWSI